LRPLPHPKRCCVGIVTSLLPNTMAARIEVRADHRRRRSFVSSLYVWRRRIRRGAIHACEAHSRTLDLNSDATPSGGSSQTTVSCRHPNGDWMKQVARNLTDMWDGFLLGTRYLIHDRDPLFTEEVRGLLRDAGVKPLRLPAKSPNLNAYAERFVLSLRRECLDRIIPFSERHLRTAIAEYLVHYHTERNHQSLGNELIKPLSPTANDAVPIMSRERLGGVLKYYYRAA